jgi:hypothetical protein
MLTRRRFVTDTVILTLVPVVVGCGDDEQDPSDCDGAGATSSVDGGHSHTVCVASADLMNPPTAGARYTTSSDDGHTHEIELSADQLTQIAGGSEVTVMATVVDGHGHTFSLSSSE